MNFSLLREKGPNKKLRLLRNNFLTDNDCVTTKWIHTSKDIGLNKCYESTASTLVIVECQLEDLA